MFLMNIIINIFFRLECQIQAVPPPIISWHVNGLEIAPSPHYEILLEPTKDESILRSTLQIINVGPEDTGEYCCKAKSDIGETESSTTLFVTGT